MSWQDFTDAAPDLAAFGAERLHDRVTYLATWSSSKSRAERSS